MTNGCSDIKASTCGTTMGMITGNASLALCEIPVVVPPSMSFESICRREVAGDVWAVGCEYNVVGRAWSRVCVERSLLPMSKEATPTGPGASFSWTGQREDGPTLNVLNPGLKYAFRP